MKNIRSIFYATDKDIYDLVHTSRKKISDNVIIEMLRARKIIVCQKEVRENLIDYFSAIQHDYYSREFILEQTERGHRAEKINYKEFPITATSEEIRIALDSVKSKRTKNHNENHNFILDAPTSFKLNVDYQEMDLGRTRLSQHRERDAEINIEFSENGVKVRGPANPVADAIILDLKKELEELKKEKIQESVISLKGINDAGKRSRFFLMIMKNMEGFMLDDVTALHTDRLEEAEAEDLDEEEKEEKDTELLGDVRRAVLSGRGLTYSIEFQRLSDSGFFISKIQWISRGKNSPYNKIEFEAGFGNPTDGTDFSYNIRGVYRAKSDGTYTKTKVPIEDSEKKELLRILENTSKLSLEKLKAAE